MRGHERVRGRPLLLLHLHLPPPGPGSRCVSHAPAPLTCPPQGLVADVSVMQSRVKERLQRAEAMHKNLVDRTGVCVGGGGRRQGVKGRGCLGGYRTRGGGGAGAGGLVMSWHKDCTVVFGCAEYV